MDWIPLRQAPPVGEAVINTFKSEDIDMFAIMTLVDGPIGEYITFAGGHRLLDADVKGIDWMYS